MQQSQEKRNGKPVISKKGIAKFVKFYKGAKFFPVYAPGVTNWNHKMRGKDGHGKEINFTPDDLKAILSGMDSLAKDIAGRGGANS